MKKLIYRTPLVALAAGIIVLVVSVPNVARAKAHPTTARHIAKCGVKHGTGKTGSRSVRATFSVQASASADASVLAPLPGISRLSPAQAQQSVDDEETGQQAFSSGDLNTAEADFRHSTDLDRSNTSALVGLAQTLEREGKTHQAIDVYRYLLYPKRGWGTSWEDDPILRMHFAMLLSGDGQWPEAVFVYERVIGGISFGSSFPDVRVHFSPDIPRPVLLQAMAHLAMGITYTNRLEHAQALPEYAAAVSIQPDLAVADYYYGRSLTRLGHRAEAKAAFEQARSVGGDDVKAAAEGELRRPSRLQVSVTEITRR